MNLKGPSIEPPKLRLSCSSRSSFHSSHPCYYGRRDYTREVPSLKFDQFDTCYRRHNVNEKLRIMLMQGYGAETQAHQGPTVMTSQLIFPQRGSDVYVRSGHHARRLNPKKSLLGSTVSTRFIGAEPLLLLECTYSGPP